MWEPVQAYGLPLLAAVAAGGLIGFEREWRGRPAGFRTHILVSLASALLMLAAMGQGDWAFKALPDENIVTDPTRMAHGVLTGIGFLCAGVIFRTGFSIHGLTTAASLWVTSALGLLFGAGLFGLGLFGTLTTVVILVGLRLVTHHLPRQPLTDVVVVWRREDVAAEAAVEAALSSLDRQMLHDRFELIDEGRHIQRSWRIRCGSERELKSLAAKLCAITAVTGYRLDPRDD